MADLFVILFGLAAGSFLNVCIHRLPRDQSLIKPGSACPACGKSIAWKDNIPVLSYLWLRGRCRSCRARISPRYAVVEAVNALGWLWLWKRSGGTVDFIFAALFFSILLGVICTDFETGLIPDEFTLTGLAAGLLWAALAPERLYAAGWSGGLLMSFWGGLLGGGLLFLTGYLGQLFFHKDSMGGGDIKLLAMLGTFLGAYKVVLVFLIAPVLALPVSLAVCIRYGYAKGKETAIPFGPYLAAAGAFLFFFGDWLSRHFFGVL